MRNANATKYTPRQPGRLASQIELLQQPNRGKNADMVAYRRAQFNNSAMMMQPNYSQQQVNALRTDRQGSEDARSKISMHQQKQLAMSNSIVLPN